MTSTDAATSKQPFAAGTVYRFLDNDSFAGVDTAKRLTIQTVSTSADGGSGSSRFQTSSITTLDGSLQSFALPIVSDFGIPFAGATQSMTLSNDSSTTARFECLRPNSVSTQYVRVTVYGYLVDAP